MVLFFAALVLGLAVVFAVVKAIVYGIMGWED